jgi:hypothetical protein
MFNKGKSNVLWRSGKNGRFQGQHFMRGFTDEQLVESSPINLHLLFKIIRAKELMQISRSQA